MTLKNNAKFEEKMTCGFKNGMRKVASCFTRALEILKIGTLMGSFCSKQKMYMSLKFTRELYVMTMKNDAKFEEELTYHFKVDMSNLTNVDPMTQKCRKNCSLVGSFNQNI